ncbi:MAG TPA: hypothetical protein PLP05_11215, partial [Sedimentisphaerales bacterium]|nr:hypothetical protein [Sedimentisphaerales bacterium]
LSGKQIATSNHGDVLIQKVFSKNKKQGELSYNYGLVLPEIEDVVQDGFSDEYVPVAKIIMWGKSKLAVYDKDENEIYEKFFFGLDLNIEKAIPCGPARSVIFTSECEHPVEYDQNWEKYKTKRRISFVVIDYCRDSNDLQQGIIEVNLQTIDNFGFNLKDTQQSVYSGIRLVSVDEFSSIDITSSQDHRYVGGVINNTTVFVINIDIGKTIFIKPLIKSVNGNNDNKVLQMEVSDSGDIHILRYYTGNEDLLVSESYDNTDNATKMQIVEDFYIPDFCQNH